MAAIDDLREEVTSIGDVVDGAVALIGNLVQRLNDALASDDTDELEAQITQLRDELDAHGTELAEAIAANTPTPAPLPSEPEPMPDLPATDPNVFGDGSRTGTTSG